MDYSSMHVVNSQHKTINNREYILNPTEHQDQSNTLQTMVTKDGLRPVLVGVMPCHDKTENSFHYRSGHVINEVKYAGEPNVNSSETKIKLNFSVDRLLSLECGNSSNIGSQRVTFEADTLEECNKYPNKTSHNKLEELNGQRGVLLPSSMDIKAVVRPTPIRALSGGPEEVLSYSSMASSVMKFHQHQHQRQQHHHHQPGGGSFAALSSLMAPFNGLKALQINHQHFRQHTNIQPAIKSLDIPPTTSITSTIASGLSNSATVAATVPTSNGPSSAPVITSNGKRKRSWSRAVFSNLQRKGLEIQFQQQKYITKPDRRKLAARLNLTDAQVKVWFQNRRMKWRHTRENLKSGQEKSIPSIAGAAGSTNPKGPNDNRANDAKSYTTSSDSNDDEIDVVE